ncbi:3-oxoacyl-ACP synthase III family protein [Aquicoccus sp.]|uniref:3-oxoacyl-ACP synthase III family protein n=1 Tax=Aquicoccus sp. TaxID=2055851 RepID=UPI00356129C7
MTDLSNTQGIAPRIIGTGYSIPSKVRTNDDPIFDWLKNNQPEGKDLFKGFDVRHVLSDDEKLIDIMKPAAQMALASAGIEPDDIDIIIGDGSISNYRTPNTISELHQALGLCSDAWPLPLLNSFSQFNAAVMISDAMIKAGSARHVLIALGDNWTRFVEYTTPQAISAGDGAAACVVGPMKSQADWQYVDSFTIADTSYYGSMYMASDFIQGEADTANQEFTHPFFHITSKGIEGFKKFGVKKAPEAVKTLMERNGVAPRDVCLIGHQASSVLTDHWTQIINPGFCINTLKKFANLVQSSVPFNLAWATRNESAFTQNYVVTLCLGPDMHANAMLLRRNS